jgi:predicted transcriptional regulator
MNAVKRYRAAIKAGLIAAPRGYVTQEQAEVITRMIEEAEKAIDSGLRDAGGDNG